MVRPHSFVFWGSYSMLQHHQEFHGISQSQDVGVQNASHSCHGWQPRTPNLAELWITEHDPGDFFSPVSDFQTIFRDRKHDSTYKPRISRIHKSHSPAAIKFSSHHPALLQALRCRIGRSWNHLPTLRLYDKKTIRYMDSINYLWIYNDLYLYRYPSIQPNFHTVIQNSIFSLRSHVVSQFEDILSGRAKSSLPVQSHHRARAQPIREKSAISAKKYPWRMNSGWAYGLCIHSITNMFWICSRTHTQVKPHISFDFNWCLGKET